jgi:uncharacterized protein (DUF58 family)
LPEARDVMLRPRVPRRAATGPQRERGVRASLDELVRLQFMASGFNFLPRQPVHSVLTGRHASRLRGRGLNFEELRAYLPGDDVRGIDWKVLARTGKPHVRVYTEERDRPVWLLIDQRRSMFFGSRERMKSVAAAEAAALAAWRTLAVGDRVGAVIFGDDAIVELPPRRDRNHVERILSEIVCMNRRLRAGDGRTPEPAQLNAAFERVARQATHDALVVTIGDGFGADEYTRRLVTRVCAHNDVLAVFVYDPLERELPAAGPLVFGDPRGQLEVDSGQAGLRRRFTRAFDERLEWLGRLARQHAVPLLSIHTSAPVADQVRDLLGHRPAVRRR